MDQLWKLLGLAGPLDETGEGYEPSPFSKMLAVDSKTNYEKLSFDKKYSGDKKVLVVCTEERYMTMANEKKFSTGMHPVETCQVLMHLVDAGFEFVVATPTGKPAVIEMWALPTKDEVFMTFFNDIAQPKFKEPKSLVDVAKSLDNYLCLFLPGGHGAMLGLPEDPNLGKAINHFKEKEKYLVSVCHGPAALLASKADPHPFEGYKIACFPDSIDKQTPMIGYLPGHMPWYFGEKLSEKGFKIVNSGADATVEADRTLLTGASPKACQALGKLTVEKLLEKYA